MVRKTKSKSGAGKKPAKKKKSTKKAKPAITGDVVGIISTVNITRDMKQAIRTGMANPNVRLRFCYVGSYKKAKLKRKLTKFNNNADIKLVLTLGGNKTYEAAKLFSL